MHRTMKRLGKFCGYAAGLWVVAGLVPGLVVGRPAAQEIDPREEYQACLRQVETAPKKAYDRAGTWRALGGGAAADHCQAAALLRLDQPEGAAILLEQAAQDAVASAEVKAGLLRAAAEAWVQAGQGDRAEAVLDAALEVTPGAPALLEDRALVRAGRGALWDAVDDLNDAIAAEPGRVSALVLRGAAYRKLEAPTLAEDDLRRAVDLDPAAPDAWLELGNLARDRGDRAAAREDWMKVLRLAPEGPSADAARANIEGMDVRAE